MGPQTVIACCLVVLAVAAVAYVVRKFVADVALAQAETERQRQRSRELRDDLATVRNRLDVLSKTCLGHSRALDTAHADLMQLFDATGVKRERL